MEYLRVDQKKGFAGVGMDGVIVGSIVDEEMTDSLWGTTRIDPWHLLGSHVLNLEL
jgi:hypothetical protein